MDTFEKCYELIDQHLSQQEPQISQAWQRLKALIATSGAASLPPHTLGAAMNGVNDLASHLHIMALTGQRPSVGTQAMELLIFRWVKANEFMGDVLAELLVEQGQAQNISENIYSEVEQ